VPDATTYFEDHAVDLGAWTLGATAPVTLTVLTDVTASQADQRFFANLLLANATPGSGGLPGDADRDGIVQFADFQILEQHLGAAGGFEQGDFDGSGFVDTDDFRVFNHYFNQKLASPSELSAIDAFAVANHVGVDLPEPGAAVWGGLLLLALASGRRRRVRASQQPSFGASTPA
jgi:hypothetical protein